MSKVMDQLEQESGICRECRIVGGHRPILDYVELCPRHAAMDNREWQAIETAPKDGTPIVGFWRPAPGGAITPDCYGVTYHELGEWLNPEDPDDTYAEPSLWMPLPDPPTTE